MDKEEQRAAGIGALSTLACQIMELDRQQFSYVQNGALSYFTHP